MLQEKLLRKSDDQEMTEKVLQDIESLIVEERVIESRVHGYISQGKTERFIRLKLLQKKFDSSLVDAALQNESENLGNPETYRIEIERHIRKAEQKCISRRILSYELKMKYPDAQELFTELLREYSDHDAIIKKAPELLKKYSQEQVVTKLCQKGFSLSDVYAVLRRR